MAKPRIVLQPIIGGPQVIVCAGPLRKGWRARMCADQAQADRYVRLLQARFGWKLGGARG